jgi:hypothetical protein
VCSRGVVAVAKGRFQLQVLVRYSLSAQLADFVLTNRLSIDEAGQSARSFLTGTLVESAVEARRWLLWRAMRG